MAFCPRRILCSCEQKGNCNVKILEQYIRYIKSQFCYAIPKLNRKQHYSANNKPASLPLKLMPSLYLEDKRGCCNIPGVLCNSPTSISLCNLFNKLWSLGERYITRPQLSSQYNLMTSEFMTRLPPPILLPYNRINHKYLDCIFVSSFTNICKAHGRYLKLEGK